MENPYQSSAHAGELAAGGAVSSGTLQALAATRPWVRLCSVLGFVGSGFMILGGIAIVVAGAFGGAGGPEMAIAAVYLVMAAIYLIPSIKLWTYGSAISDLMRSSSVRDLEEALQRQQGFWKFAGIMALVMIGLMVLAMFGGLLVGILAAASR